MSEKHFRSHFYPFHIETQLCYFEIFDKMSDVGHFGCPNFTYDRISGHFRSLRNFNFLGEFLTKWLTSAILNVRISLSIVFVAISDRYATFFLNENFDKMADVGHFGCPIFTFGRISSHFRSICNFFFF